MAIWRIESLTGTPDVKLVDWAVIEVESKIWKGKTRHVIGLNASNAEDDSDFVDQEFHVSIAINAYDSNFRRALDRTGQMYSMIGKPTDEMTTENEYKFRRWLHTNEIVSARLVSAAELG